MDDRIAKQRLNVILLVDCSTSMRGDRIREVNEGLRDIKNHLIDMQNENTNVDFYITVITFSTDARYLNGDTSCNISEFDFNDIKAGGWSNLHLAYEKLDNIMAKESKGGIMPDFGGIAPIILLLTDGHPTGQYYKEYLASLESKPWFRQAIRYGIAIELNDDRTRNVLKEFCGNNGDVIDCYSSDMLERIIKVIVLTSSKVKSTPSNVARNKEDNKANIKVKQCITEALSDIDGWEW